MLKAISPPHLNIVHLVEYSAESYLALKYANGKCFINFLTVLGQKHSYNNEKWSRYLFRQVMEGLKAINDKGIAHLDIKIDNVFLHVPTEDD